jgi:DNA-binding NtrC family response regulator
MRKHHTILLVEDENDVRWLMATALRRLGYTVIEARTVAEALTSFADANDTVTLLLSAVLLSDGTGPELYRLLAASNPCLRLLLTSGCPESVLVELIADGPVTDFILRPFSLDGLAEKVRDVVRAHDEIAEPLVRSRVSTAGHAAGAAR